MTKKDYIVVAEALRPFIQNIQVGRENWYELQTSKNVVAEFVEVLCNAFEKQNPKFNRINFSKMVHGLK